MSLPNLSILTLATKVAAVGVVAGKRQSRGDQAEEEPRDGDHAKRFMYSEPYRKLIAKIMQQLSPFAPESWLSYYNCAAGGKMFTDAALKRDPISRSTILDTIAGFSFRPQESSGFALKRHIGQETAIQIASLFFKAVDAMAAANIRTGNDYEYKVLMDALASEEGVWKRFAKEGVDALKEVDEVKRTQVVRFAVTVQRANQATYASRASFVHMDAGIGPKGLDTYGRANKDNPGLNSFVATFCAERPDTTTTGGGGGAATAAPPVILTCGTIVYKSVPIVNTETIVSIASQLKKNDEFAQCTDIERLVSQVASSLNQATTNALRDYTDADLKSMGITTTAVNALLWVNTHQSAFHRSPLYADIDWIKPDAQPDWRVRGFLQWIKDKVGVDGGRASAEDGGARDTKMRFFSRMFVEKTGTRTGGGVDSVQRILDFEFDGIKARVDVRLI